MHYSGCGMSELQCKIASRTARALQHDPTRTTAGRYLTLLVDGSMVDNTKAIMVVVAML